MTGGDKRMMNVGTLFGQQFPMQLNAVLNLKNVVVKQDVLLGDADALGKKFHAQHYVVVMSNVGRTVHFIVL